MVGDFEMMVQVHNVDVAKLHIIKDCLQTVLLNYFKRVGICKYTAKINAMTMYEFTDMVSLCFKRVLCYKNYRKYVRNSIYGYCTHILRTIMRKMGCLWFLKSYAIETLGMLQRVLNGMCTVGC